MFKRIINLPKRRSFFLFGARGTGKTTIIKQCYLGERSLHIDLLRSKPYTDLSLNPGLLREQILANKELDCVVLDEIQKIPALLDEVHSLMEDFPDIQFILTGSSARKLKRGGANLLAGRAQVHHLHTFTCEEVEQSFCLEDAVTWGMLPKIFGLTQREDKIEFLRAYATTYLKEEILQEQLIRKLEPFQRFLPIAAQMSGKIINYASIARDVGVAPATVENYFQILTDTLVGFFLPPYHPSIRKQERVSPKYYIFDLGVVRALAGQLEIGTQPGTSYYGELFEQFIIQEIIKRSSYTRKDDKFHYYQSDSGLEVDLVITRPTGKNIYLEIKSSDKVKEEHLRNLEKLHAEFPNDRFYCFSRDETSKQLGKIRCLHWKDGIRELLED